MVDDALHELWPLFGLRLRIACPAGPLLLAIPRDEQLATLARLAAAGVHAPAQMPFTVPWTRAQPPDLERAVMQYHWRERATFSRSDWTLAFVVLLGEEIVGTQDLSARDFAVRRSVDTGSWLGQSFQGRGIGTAMRRAVLDFAFEHLGAVVAYTAAFEDNLSSIAVSRKLGYRDNGKALHNREGQPAWERHFVMTREDWEPLRRAELTVEGLQPCRDLLGVE